MLGNRLIRVLAAGSLVLVGASAASARELGVVPVDLGDRGERRVVEGSIVADEIVDHALEGEVSRILSVDMMSSNPAANFNILPCASADALFVGSTRGRVADVRLPDTGSYVVRVYLSRSAARRGEIADYSLAIALGAPEFADGLSGGPDYWAVSGIEPGSTLNLRRGPDTRYARIGGLGSGERLRNRGCRLSGDERWCAVRAARSGTQGWVAGRYLVEAAPPRAPSVPPGGPVGNGGPFDATGTVSCAHSAERPRRRCPFGVVREGSGSAGVWITSPEGEERHILFEDGAPVSTNSTAPPEFEKVDDVFFVDVGAENYEIPEAVLDGG